MATSLDDVVKNYQKKITDGYTPTDYSKQYQAIGNNLQSAYDAQFAAQKEQLAAQKEQLGQEYRSQRSDAYVNAKKNALLNNEILAANGLAHSAHGANTSGVSEMNRVNADAALLKNINALNVAEQQGTTEIDRSILAAQYQKDLDVATALAELEREKLSAQQQEDQFGRGYNLDVYNALVSQNATQAQNAQAAAELAETRKQNAYNNALSEIALYGYVKTDAAAAALGLKKGTKLTKKQLKALGVT